ncbi:MAG: hypothetical protein KAJ18_08640 [Candidatus Omnitrophica bacterium]|nr:hypothetical protein [Candidatus Omnitrophota bacterium]
MSENALTSQGIVLAIGSGSPVSYTAIPEIKTFNGPGGAGQVIDVTDLDSAAMEKIMGLPDEGQLSFDINYIPDNAVHVSLRTARENQTLTPMKITFTDTTGTVWTFNAYVTGFTVTGGVNAALNAAVTLEITGAIAEA